MYEDEEEPEEPFIDPNALFVAPKPGWKVDKPPLSAEHWVEKQGMGQWPLPPSQTEIQNYTEQFPDLFCTQEDMSKLFIDGINIDWDPLDVVETQLDSLEERLSTYSEMLLEKRERKKTVYGITCVPTEFEIGSGEINQEIMNAVKIRKPHQEQKVSHGGGRARTIQFALFPGYDSWELTPLPRQIEAPQILYKVTKGLNLEGLYSKVWRKYFLSQGSVALLQDIFWWVLMEKFNKDKGEQDRLYNRIADSYVSLFLNIEEKFKDFFLKHYPSALAQSLYSTFCTVYTYSLKHFDDDFKTFLCNLTSEWICGSTPPPLVWSTWPLHLLEPNTSNKDEDGRKSGLKIEHGSTDEKPVSPMFSSPRIEPESQPAGSGPIFERVQFNLFGRSPLVAHYLQTRNLGGDTLSAKLVSRTQIEKLQAPKPTYREIIAQAKKVFGEFLI